MSSSDSQHGANMSRQSDIEQWLRVIPANLEPINENNDAFHAVQTTTSNQKTAYKLTLKGRLDYIQRQYDSIPDSLQKELSLFLEEKQFATEYSFLNHYIKQNINNPATEFNLDPQELTLLTPDDALQDALQDALELIRDNNTATLGWKQAITSFCAVLLDCDDEDYPCILSIIINANRITAEAACEQLWLRKILSPKEKNTLLQSYGLTDTAKMIQAVNRFIIPNIKITLSNNVLLGSKLKKQKILNSILFLMNTYFYEQFSDSSCDLNTLRSQFAKLLDIVQQKRFSIKLFARAPGDTQSAKQLIDYFKLPESLKARELLQKAFGHQIFPDISVSVFEASLKKFMAKLISPKPAVSSHIYN